MILLTKLDKTPILLSFDSVKFIEAVPDTIITFLNGDSLIVQETLDQIKKKYTQFINKTKGT